MRNLSRLAGLALLVPSVMVAAACEDASSSSGGGVFEPEGGASFEAGPPPEAGALDSALPDAAPPVPKGVTVTVVANGAPKKDARVLTHDAAGAVVADLKTDAAGKVTLAAAPSMVTVLTMRGTDGFATYAPVTFVGVADDDALLVDATDPEASNATDMGKYLVSFGPAVDGATVYHVEVGSSCSGQSATVANAVSVDLFSYCTGAQNAVLVRANSGTSDLAYAFQKNVPTPAINTTANVGPLTFAAKGATTVTAAALPAGTSASARLFSIANGAAFLANDRLGKLEAGGVSFATATGFAEAYQVDVEASVYQNGGTQRKAFIRREAATVPAAASQALGVVDFSGALPFVSGALTSGTTPARPEITITGEAPLTAADGTVAELYWYAGGESSGRWTFVLPPSTTMFKAPALPADAPLYTPVAGVAITDVTVVEATQLPGYKELKRLPVATGGLAVVDSSRPLPAAGTVRISRWQPGD